MVAAIRSRTTRAIGIIARTFARKRLPPRGPFLIRPIVAGHSWTWGRHCKNPGDLDEFLRTGKRQDAASTVGTNVEAASCRLPYTRIWVATILILVMALGNCHKPSATIASSDSETAGTVAAETATSARTELAAPPAPETPSAPPSPAPQKWTRPKTTVAAWDFSSLDKQQWEWYFPGATPSKTPQGAMYTIAESAPGPMLRKWSLLAQDVSHVEVEMSLLLDVGAEPAAQEFKGLTLFWARTEDVAAAPQWPYANERAVPFLREDPALPNTWTANVSQHRLWNDVIDHFAIMVDVPTENLPAQFKCFNIFTRQIQFLCEVPPGFGKHSLDEAVVRPDEEAGDSPHYRALQAQEDRAFLDAKLAECFDQPGVPLNEESAVRLFSYVSQKLRLPLTREPPAYQKTATKVLQQDYVLCGGFSVVLTALWRRVGFPARQVVMDNLELFDSHTCAEVYYDNAWHFFDPTEGVFFRARAHDGKWGPILSLRQLLISPDRAANAFGVSRDKLWSGKFDPKAPIGPLPAGQTFTNPPYERVPLHECYHQMFAESFPTARMGTLSAAQSYPVDIDLRGVQAVWVGAVDNDNEDLRGIIPNSVDPTGPVTFTRNRPPHVIGPLDLFTAFHTLFIKADRPLMCRVTYHFLPEKVTGVAPDLAELGAVELKDVLVSKMERGPDTWSAEVNLRGRDAVLLVFCRKWAAHLDAIHVEVLTGNGGK